MCHCLAARKRARELTRRFDAAFRAAHLPLRSTQFSIMAALSQTGSVPMSRLANILGLERTTLTRVAGGMTEKGWLTIRTAKEDERVRVLGITAAGVRVLANALPVWRETQDACN